MLTTFTGRGVVRALACFLAVVAFAAATPSLSLAQALASNPAAFAAAWQNGTPTTVTGTLTAVYADDFANQRFERRYFVRDEQSGLTFQVRFEKEPAVGFRTGSVVRFVGHAFDSDLYVAASQADTSLVTAPSSTPGVGTQTSNLATSDQRTLVMMANFADANLTCTATDINNMMFAGAAGFPAGYDVDGQYRESSRGAISWSGKIVGTYQLNATTADPCALVTWANAIDGQAAAAGVDVASYPHKVYVLPYVNACAAAGVGSIGGTPTYAWILSCNSSAEGLFAHELGHNLGMDHSATDENGTINEYGDWSDPMAMSTWQLRGFNAPHRHQMGWVSPQAITQSGTYSIAPLAQDPSAASTPQVYVIPKRDTGELYYLSYRLAQGFDSYIPTSYIGELTVHRYKGDGSAAKTYLAALLADGQSYVDPVNGITVTQVSHDSTRVTANVQVNATCVASAPSVTLSPQSQNGVAGSALSYTVSLTNADGTACAPSSFALSRTVPSGWTGALSTPSLTLSPGATGQATLTLTSPFATPVGAYGATVNAGDATTVGHATSAVAAYQVQPAPDSSSPTAPTKLTVTASQKLKQLRLSWAASSDNVAVAGYRVWRNGAMIGAATTSNFIDAAYVSGSSYTYYVAAYDAAGNVSSPSNSVTVTLSGGKK